MAMYVVRTFDPSGRLVDRETFRAPDDGQAAARLRMPREDHWCELWCDTRLVMILDGAKLAPPDPAPNRLRSPTRA